MLICFEARFAGLFSYDHAGQSFESRAEDGLAGRSLDA
jgi:hypothetical protein